MIERLRLSDDLVARIDRALSLPDASMVELTEVLALDPQLDFINQDLEGVDVEEALASGFNLHGAKIDSVAPAEVRVEGEEKSSLNKSDLAKLVSEKTGLSRAQAVDAVDAAIEAIIGSVRSNESVQLAGFGTFYATHRKLAEFNYLTTKEKKESLSSVRGRVESEIGFKSEGAAKS